MGQGLPKVLDLRSAKKLLVEHGWTCTEGAKHTKMIKDGRSPVMLPRRNGDYAKGLTRAILEQAGLIEREDG